MVGRWDVDLGGDRRSGSGPAGRRDWQAVQEIIARSRPAGELNERKSMLVKLSTGKTVSETAAALQAAVQANHFGVMQVHNLKETMTKIGVEFARD